MRFSTRKFYDLVLYRRTIPRTTRRNCPTVHRGTFNVLFDDGLSFGAQLRDPAWHLLRVTRLIPVSSRVFPEVRPRIVEILDFAFLASKLCIIDEPPFDPWRRSGCRPF